MEMPDVFEFLRSLYDQPAAHQFLRAYFEYDPRRREQMSNDTANYLAGSAVPEVPFDRLPVKLQNALFRESGFKTFKEFIEDRKRREQKALAQMN
jgi:hypothetical protein